MQIDVTGVNEYEFIPEIAGNEKEEHDKQWRIVVRRFNFGLECNKFKFKTDSGLIDYDNYQFLKRSIVKFVNAPNLVKEGGEKEELTVETFLSDKYPELYPVVIALYSYMEKLIVSGSGIETKK